MEVINCKIAHLRRNGYSSLVQWLDASPNHIYIGRDMTKFVPGAAGSKWGNPYKPRDYPDIDQIVELYERHVRESGLIDQIGELDGKVLGCWCKPNRCHGDILVKLVEEWRRGQGGGRGETTRTGAMDEVPAAPDITGIGSPHTPRSSGDSIPKPSLRISRPPGHSLFLAATGMASHSTSASQQPSVKQYFQPTPRAAATSIPTMQQQPPLPPPAEHFPPLTRTKRR
ncbi:hypothetical protein HDV00_009591 [Rhizophlyctis rosea]|nr:hypothetical protein HDV00_009591 [Rhizophlyctis rosea]